MKYETLRNYSLLVLLALFWGPSFFFIKIAVEDIPPATLVALRVGTGTVLLWIIAAISGKKPWRFVHMWKHFLVVGITASALPFFLITYGELYIPSSLAAITNASVPIFTALLAHYFIPTEPLGISKSIGILLGFIGICAIFLPSVLEHSHANELGVLLIVLASISYGVGMVYTRKYLNNVPTLIAPCWQTLVAFLCLVPFSLIFDRPFSLPMPSQAAWMGIGGLILFGTVLAFVLYFEIAKIAGASFLSLVTLLFPLVGIILGVWLLGESLSWNAYVGCVLILLGLAVANPNISFRKKEAS